MKNVKMTIIGETLRIEVDLLAKGDLSKSGKSIIIASTEGNKAVPDIDDVKIGLNVYKANK